jgi:hypothetical protein
MKLQFNLDLGSKEWMQKAIAEIPDQDVVNFMRAGAILMLECFREDDTTKVGFWWASPEGEALLAPPEAAPRTLTKLLDI